MDRKTRLATRVVLTQAIRNAMILAREARRDGLPLLTRTYVDDARRANRILRLFPHGKLIIKIGK